MDDVEVVLLHERGCHRGVEHLGHRLAEARRRGLGEDGVEALCGCLVLARADQGHLVPSCREAVGVARSMLGRVVPPRISSLLLSGLEPTRRARPPLASASALHEIGRRRARCRASSPGVWVARSASSSSATRSSSSKTRRIPATLTPSRMSARAARSRRMSALLYRRWSPPLRVGVTLMMVDVENGVGSSRGGGSGGRGWTAVDAVEIPKPSPGPSQSASARLVRA